MAAAAVEAVAEAAMVVVVPVFVVFACPRVVYSGSCPVMIACGLEDLVYCSRTEERIAVARLALEGRRSVGLEVRASLMRVDLQVRRPSSLLRTRASQPLPLFSFIQSYSPSSTSPVFCNALILDLAKIISSRLFPAEMRVDTHVTRGATQAFPLSVWDVLLRLRIAVLLCHAKIDDVDDVLCFRVWPADEEVVRLDVTVYQVLLSWWRSAARSGRTDLRDSAPAGR
ncbi:hypothetical protein KC347_g238 [Hortaea werneckii]|nr:hypothetical protein KC347_g238 [Hortaea werneckii]